MLESVGVTAVEEDVYRLLIATATASAEEIASCTGLSPGQTEGVLAALAAKGLASPTGHQPHEFSACPPDVILLPRIQRRADALDQARTALNDLVESYASSRRRQNPGALVEVITGAETLRQHLRQLQEGARHEMQWFCKAQYVAMPSGSNREEFDALSRGVRYRVLYERAFFDDEDAIDNVIDGVRAGEMARSVPHLPLRMAVADRTVAICPLVPGGPNGSTTQPTAALLRDSSLVEGLTSLFDHYWENAVPLAVSGSASGGHIEPGAEGAPLRDTDCKVLSLLVAGVSDKAIATQMGLSRRTVQRRIQHMMALADATTRMQLAWCAARRGWL
ncbi:helix-turn-helix domain-containing protein [Streptomyces sp. NPDC059979]|uniref:helix-turn-helix domain-containing protein n=1 Tax=Streptomyces sp. NPDC059979 TaxID=3347021 RepID=UPI00368B266B